MGAPPDVDVNLNFRDHSAFNVTVTASGDIPIPGLAVNVAGVKAGVYLRTSINSISATGFDFSMDLVAQYKIPIVGHESKTLAHILPDVDIRVPLPCMGALDRNVVV